MTTNVKMKAPEGISGAGIGETAYEVDENGHVEVFAGHVKALQEHGFVVVSDKAKADEKKQEKLGLKKDQ